jgi:hypothetical protein
MEEFTELTSRYVNISFVQETTGTLFVGISYDANSTEPVAQRFPLGGGCTKVVSNGESQQLRCANATHLVYRALPGRCCLAANVRLTADQGLPFRATVTLGRGDDKFELGLRNADFENTVQAGTGTDTLRIGSADGDPAQLQVFTYVEDGLANDGYAGLAAM